MNSHDANSLKYGLTSIATLISPTIFASDHQFNTGAGEVLFQNKYLPIITDYHCF